MNELEKKRRYHSPRRQAQAQETRVKLLQAARRLFAINGYVGTTLPAIGREAGVSPATVTAVFGTKSAILDVLIKKGVRGDEEPAPLAARPWWQAVLQEPDPIRQLQQYAANIRQIHDQTTDLFEIVRGAATADPEIAALRRELTTNRLQDDMLVAESLAQKQVLDPNMTLEQARDLLWALGSADLYRMLVVERGWSPVQYQQWLAGALVDALVYHHKPCL